MAHTHTIVDHDDHFIIDPITRRIRPETPAKNKLVRHDHKSERYTFSIPRMIEDHDMTLCDSVRIHYLNVASNNIESSAGVYEVDDMGLLEGSSDTVAFSWLVDRGSTEYAGILSFAIEFKCVTDGVVVYAWHTEIYSSIAISDVIANDETFTQEYLDTFESWKNELRDIGLDQSNAIAAKGEEVLASIPDDYSVLTQVVSKDYAKSPVGAEANNGKLWVPFAPNGAYLGDASIPESTPTGFDASKCMAVRVDVKPGETYYVKASKRYFNDPGFIENITPFRMLAVGVGMANTSPDTSETYYDYPVIRDYTAESLASIDDSYIVVIPDGASNLLINTCEYATFEISKLLPTATIIDLTDATYDQDTYYPVTGSGIPKGGLHKIQVYSTFADKAHPTWATHDSGYTCNMEVYDKAQSWGQTDGNTIATDYSWKHTTQKPCGYIQMPHSSTPVALLRGGGKYHLVTDYGCDWVVHTEVYTLMNDTVRPNAEGRFDFERGTIFANLNGEVIGGSGGSTGGEVSGDISESTVTFTENTGYEIASGENTATLFGKLRKLINTIKSKAPAFLTEGRVPIANGLWQPRYIDGIRFQGANDVRRYADCGTPGDQATKVISITNFTNTKGAIVIVRFVYTNTAKNMTLRVNGLSPKPIYHKGRPVPADYITENSVFALADSGDSWNIIGEIQKPVQPDNSGIKQTVSGTKIVLRDSANKPLSGLHVFGKTTQLVASGKNLFDAASIGTQSKNGVTFTYRPDGTVRIKGVTTDTQSETNVIPITLAPGTYAISLNADDPNLNASAISFLLSYEHEGVRVWKKDVAEIVDGDTNQYAYISVNKNVNIDITAIPQIELGSVPTEPEGYCESGITAPSHFFAPELVTIGGTSGATVITIDGNQTLSVTRDGGLSGLKVSSGGNYTDKNGQQWLCDEIDFERGVYIRRIRQVYFADTTGWTYEEGYGGFVLVLEDANYDVTPMANMYPCVNGLTDVKDQQLAISAGIHGILVKNSDFNGDLNSWVESTQTSDYWTYIQYALKTPEEIALDASTLADYRALHTNYPDTIIESDTDAPMDVTYTVDTATYISKLEARIAALEQNAVT